MKQSKGIIKEYQNKLLGVESSGSCRDFYIQDFLDEKKLVWFIKNLFDHETTFTKTGFKFLEEYYGIDHVLELLKKEEPDFPYDDSTKYTPREYLYMKAKHAIDE